MCRGEAGGGHNARVRARRRLTPCPHRARGRRDVDVAREREHEHGGGARERGETRTHAPCCCGFDLCHKCILYLYLYLYLWATHCTTRMLQLHRLHRLRQTADRPAQCPSWNATFARPTSSRAATLARLRCVLAATATIAQLQRPAQDRPNATKAAHELHALGCRAGHESHASAERRAVVRQPLD